MFTLRKRFPVDFLKKFMVFDVLDFILKVAQAIRWLCMQKSSDNIFRPGINASGKL
jgi:hypothetical protein